MTTRTPPWRLLPYLAAVAALAAAALQPSRLLAQTCDPTVLTCQEPPSVAISPPGDTWTGTAQTMTLPVQVEFCRSGTGPFASGSESYTLDGTPVNLTPGAVANGCFTSTGSLILTVGSHTFTASKTTGSATGTASETYVYALAPPVPGVAVTPDGSAVKRPGSYATTESFTVSNAGTGTGSYTVQAACSGAAVSCSASRTTFDLAPGASASVGVNYVPNGAQGATGTVWLKAWLTAQTSVRDSGSYALTVDTLGLRGKQGLRPDMRRLDRDVCVILAAGPASAFECGDLRLVHDLPGVRLLNRSRAPALVYSSQHALPQPIFVAYVAPAAGTRPDTIRAVLTVNGVNYSGRWPGWPSDTTKRIAVMLPDTLPTGVHGYTLTVTGTWNSGAPAQSIYTATNEFVVVNRQRSPFGAGWWLAGLERLVPASNNRWLWVGGDGSYHVYSLVDAGTTWVTDTYDRPDTLRLVNGLLVRRLPGRTEVRYDSYGYHYQTVDPRGIATTFNWSADRSKLNSITLPVSGYSYSFTYGNDGGTRLSSVTSPGAQGSLTTTVTTASDGTGRVTQITDPDAKSVGFGYTGADWRVMKRTDRRNWTTRFTYGEGSKLTSSRVPVAVGDTIATTFRAEEGQGVTTAAASAYTYQSGPRSGMSTSWVLDTYGAPYRLAEQLRGDTYIYRGDPRFPGLVTRVDYPNGRTVTASYDARGNITATTDWGTSDGSRYATTLVEWDALCDKPTRVTSPEGQVTSRSYTSFCEPEWVRPGGDPARQVTFAYRALTDATAPGQIASTTLPQLSGQAAPPVETYDYDTRGNLFSVTSPLGTNGSRTESVSDAVGRDTLTRVQVTSSAWEVTRHLYDVLGRDTLTETTGPALSLNNTPEQRLTVRTRRDAEGNVTSVLRSSYPDDAHLDSVVTRFAYDGAGRKVRETAPDGQKDTTAYDPAGNITWTRSRRGIQSWMQYDALNRITRRIVDSVSYAPATKEVRLLQNNARVGGWTFPYYPAPAAGTRLAFAADTSTFTYDQIGNLRSADNHDARVHRTYYANGLLKLDSVSIRTWAEVAAGGSETLHTYVLQYAYDLSGRRTQLTHPSSLAPVNANTGASYTQQQYAYDPATGGLSRVTSVLGLNYGFFYNLHGQVDSTAYPGGTGEKVTYDLDGRIASRTLAGVNYKPAVAGLDVIHHPVYTYGDRRGKVTDVSESGGESALASNLTLQYSGLGMLTYEHGTIGAGSQAKRPDERYASDALGNRVSALVSPANYASLSAYDSVTKRLISTHPPTNVTFVDGLSPQATLSSYDAAGNLEWYQLDDHGGKMYSITRNYYGGDDRLRASERWTCSVTSLSYTNSTDFSANCIPPESLNSANGGAFEDYRYDALGRRVLVRTRRAPYCTSSSCASTLTRSVWDGDQLLYEVRAKGGPTETAATLESDGETGAFWGRVAYTHGLGIDRPLDIIRIGYTLQPNDGVDYGFGDWGGPYPIIPLSNWRGVVDAATTADGRMLPCQAGTACSALIHLPGNLYQAWFSPAELVERKTWFGGLIEESLDATGQMYRRNRYYNPSTGIFTQEDPIGLAGGLNVYGFADGDPVSYSDPYGLCPPRDTNEGDCPAIYWAERQQNTHSRAAWAFYGLMGLLAASQDFSDGRTLWTLIGEALSARPRPGMRLGIVPVGFGAVSAEAELAEMSGMLRTAARSKGNFGIGEATAAEANELGRAWVGEGYSVRSNGALVSRDGLRQYRPPSYKPRLGIRQANLESRQIPRGQWQSNAHIDVK